jgi:hypothetical protein
MSRENSLIKETVNGTLTGTKNYSVKIIVTARELWGQNSVPDDRAVVEVELSPMTRLVVEDGVYVLRYRFNGIDHKSDVRVVDGRFGTP